MKAAIVALLVLGTLAIVSVACDRAGDGFKPEVLN
jgi:hypothetical protein